VETRDNKKQVNGVVINPSEYRSDKFDLYDEIRMQQAENSDVEGY